MPRLIRSIALVSLGLAAALAVAACATSPDGPRPSPAAPSASPPAMQTTPDLLAAQAGLDGRLVGATGFFVSDGSRHVVCDAILESYPPQCGGAAIVVTGTIPGPVLAALETTKDQPGFTLARAWWGQVEIRGVLHAAPPGTRPTLDLVEMRVVTVPNEGG